MWKKIIFYLLLLCIVSVTVFWLGSGFYSTREDVEWQKEPLPEFVEKAPEPVSEEEKSAPLPTEERALQTVTTEGVPFIVQAPFGDWSSPLYQDACEEASITMVAYYLSGKTLNPSIGDKELLKLADYG